MDGAALDPAHLLGTIVEVASGTPSPVPNASPMHDDSDDEEFVYPGVSEDTELPSSPPPEQPPIPTEEPVPHVSSPSPSSPRFEEPSFAKQLETLHAAVVSGDLKRVQAEFQSALQSGDVEPFALANDASPRTGLTVLHAAASRGKLDVARWRTGEECGAIPDIEDKEGETALHKAALHGYLNIITYLLPDKADVHAQDADGWTALHNACQDGFAKAGAAVHVGGVPGIDARSKGGWTPLMNAASKGHLPIVLYLLNKQSADPLIRNNWGETAYDVAAAVFEVWICEVLQKAEAVRWRDSAVPYNPLAVHTTVPLILYENQRLDMRLKTLAVSGGDRNSQLLVSAGVAGEHRLSLDYPYQTRAMERRRLEPGVVMCICRCERILLYCPSQVRTTDPPEKERKGATFGYPIGRSMLHIPASMQRTAGSTLILSLIRTISGPQSSRHSWSDFSPAMALSLLGWVVAAAAAAPAQAPPQRLRIHRRGSDVDDGQMGAMYHLAADGTLIPYIENEDSDYGEGEGVELGAMQSTGFSSQDYVARARYLAGSPYADSDDSTVGDDALEARRAIAKLERATTELRQGVLGDDDVERRTQAEVLLNAYSRELDRRRLAAGAQGLLISGDEDFEVDDDDSDDEFHYPGSSPQTIRPASIRSSTTDYFSRASGSGSRGPTDLTPHLSQAPEFRVPTHEAPQKVLAPRWTPPTPHQVHAQWERDETVNECRECRRRFNFLNRRHCRRCGRIFCDRCSSYRALLDPSDVVHDPSFPDFSAVPSQQRVCQTCYEEVTATVPNSLYTSRTTSMERIFIDQRRLSIPSPSSIQSSSQLSDLAECPVCNVNLADLGLAPVQEAHVKNCLEGGGGALPQTAKYLVYKLPAESALIGTECVICLEEFVKGEVP
ncbi:hypothetical protein A0H81_03981 [Grifola frondosa]|uniref:FYVE-type domain-containing protein n=1 Tax=Grifola frondosa TaxID=5627 RepID=A0A1C7MIU2_GRIFR|nr:hypothetical protein A0H81_03981 [Grifola frondosa]